MCILSPKAFPWSSQGLCVGVCNGVFVAYVVCLLCIAIFEWRVILAPFLLGGVLVIIYFVITPLDISRLCPSCIPAAKPRIFCIYYLLLPSVTIGTTLFNLVSLQSSTSCFPLSPLLRSFVETCHLSHRNLSSSGFKWVILLSPASLTRLTAWSPSLCLCISNVLSLWSLSVAAHYGVLCGPVGSS